MLKIDYIDSLAIVDKKFKIIHSYRYNPRFDDEVLDNSYLEYIGKNFFEVYPEIVQSESSMTDAIKNNRVVYNEKQMFVDYRGRVFNTRNITIPIVREGNIVGAIELSKDITSIDDLEKISEKNNFVKKEENITKKIENIEFEDILTVNEGMKENIRMAKIFAKSLSPCLIYGETGTGKELFIQAMANYRGIKKEKKIALNCAAVPENLIESILFGSVKGAYTGACKRIGIFEQAHNGIIFLDEINSMPLQIQAKLLRFLQDGVVRKLGSEKEKKINVKIIGAMNCEPLEAIEKGFLREDLFYRLSSNLICLIPLRERREDIPIYVENFIKEFNEIYQKNVDGVTTVLMDVFMAYDWKGNVREIRHILESMVSITNEKTLTIKHLPIYMKDRIFSEPKGGAKINLKKIHTLSLTEAVSKIEKELIERALNWTNGHLTKSAEMLRIPRQTLKYKMQKLKIERKNYK
ncbi:sigma 54-interacting transcriptional regulator [Clostridiaceae bacterium HSG29]|nr:sigma 54-interacting transcriptional regulator [Clostridiaceae bacterium HSG29]